MDRKISRPAIYKVLTTRIIPRKFKILARLKN